jgi:GT2 family glycosyltransferase
MAQKISVIIPNYNGREILEKNLPNVIKNCPGCEIIVVDDGSSDESIKFLKSFRGIRLIAQPKNRGFSSTVNNGVKSAKGELVLLLNSDVSPLPGFLNPLAVHFKDNKTLFAVGAADNSFENGKVLVKGRGGAKISRGFFRHFALPQSAGETLWVSGGSGLFDRQKFLSLSGFDTAYAPFYWEDIDLSYRARKSGYYCLFEPAARVNHYHDEGAIKKTRSENYIKSISYKNQFLFFWKNISDPTYNCQHLLFLPLHFLKAALRGDWAFYKGFAKATLQIPALILNYEEQFPSNCKSDREILKNFEKH